MAQNLHKPPAARIIYAVSECLCYTEKVEFGRKCRLRKADRGKRCILEKMKELQAR